MATGMRDFTEILIRQRVISAEQLAEANQMARASGVEVGDALVRLGYATSDEVMRGKAQEHGLDFVNLSEITIPPSIVELVPESVARENAILPLARGRCAEGRGQRPERSRYARQAAFYP